VPFYHNLFFIGNCGMAAKPDHFASSNWFTILTIGNVNIELQKLELDEGVTHPISMHTHNILGSKHNTLQ
jgi:hypothetical protein